jgi:hypothetical protein
MRSLNMVTNTVICNFENGESGGDVRKGLRLLDDQISRQGTERWVGEDGQMEIGNTQ